MIYVQQKPRDHISYFCCYTNFSVVYNPHAHLLDNICFPSEKYVFSIHGTRMKKNEKVNDIETCF